MFISDLHSGRNTEWAFDQDLVEIIIAWHNYTTVNQETE